MAPVSHNHGQSSQQTLVPALECWDGSAPGCAWGTLGRKKGLEPRNLMTSALPNLRTLQDEREEGDRMHNWV